MYWALREKPWMRPPDHMYGWELSKPPSYEVVKGLEKIGGNKVIPFLSQIMNDWPGRISRAATDALGRMGNEAAIEALIHTSKNSPNEDVQRSATIALGKSGNENAILSLIDTLKNPTFNFDREPAAQALIQIGNSTIPALCDALRDENVNSDTRQEIANIMGEIGDPQVIPILLEWLINREGDPNDMRRELEQIEKTLCQIGKNTGEEYAHQYLLFYNKTRREQYEVRHVVMRALGKTGITSVVPDLIDLLSIEPRDWVIAEALACLGDKRAVEPIFNSLTNLEGEYPWLRTLLIKALGQLKDKRIIQFLMEVLANEREDNRENAAEALGNIGDPVAVEPLILALEDKSIVVRMAAARALGKIKSPKALVPLIKAIETRDFPKSGNQWEYETLILALAASVHHGDVVAGPILKSIFPTYNSRVVEATIQALGKIGDITAIDILIEPGLNIPFGMYDTVYYDDVIEELRKNKEVAIPQMIQRLSTKYDFWTDKIAKALGEIGDEKAVPILIKALENNDRSIGYAAAQTLGKIGGIEAVIPLINALKDKRKTDFHPKIVTSLGQLAESISDENTLKSARKALWQRRFTNYKENVFTAYEKVITSLTIAQVRQLSPNDTKLFSGSSAKTRLLLRLPDTKWWLWLLGGILFFVIDVATEIFSGLFAEIFGPLLPQGIIGLAILLVIIILLIASQSHFHDSGSK